jgi:hypothetical protein
MSMVLQDLLDSMVMHKLEKKNVERFWSQNRHVSRFGETLGQSVERPCQSKNKVWGGTQNNEGA